MDLVLDSSGVHYSTPLEQFETSLLNLFDKGILATHAVPQLEKVPTRPGRLLLWLLMASAAPGAALSIRAVQLYHGLPPGCSVLHPLILE